MSNIVSKISVMDKTTASITTATDPILVKILSHLARLRQMSANQIYRLCAESLKEDVENELHFAVKDKFLMYKTYEVPVATETKIRAGQSKMRRLGVYYLSAKGTRLVKQNVKKIRCLKTSWPAGELKNRMYHDLLVVETLLWFYERDNVLGFYNEDELRSDDQPTADLRVLLEADGVLSVIDCEVTVQNTRKQIEAKKDHLLWFTPSLRQADIIETVKKGAVQIIHLQDEVTQKPKSNLVLSDREEELIEALGRKGGALTANAAALVVGKDRAQTNSFLKRMVQNGCIYVSTAHTNPGKQNGRPVNVYALRSEFIDLLCDRIFAVHVSKTIENGHKNGYWVTETNRETQVITICNGTDSRRIQISQNPSG